MASGQPPGARHSSPGVVLRSPPVSQVPDPTRTVRLRILGALDLRDDRGAEFHRALAQPKRVALLAYLALAGSGAFRRRDTVVALFWPELDQPRARSALRQALSWLRRELGERVVASRGEEEIGVTPGALECDAVLFEQACDAGQPERALQLYRGELLDGVFVAGATTELQRWLEEERTRLRKLASQAAWALADRESTAGRPSHAAAWARRAAALCPSDEGEFRRLIQLLIAAGDRAGALESYARFRERLLTDYEAEPSAETQRLMAELRSDASPATLSASPAGAPPTAPTAQAEDPSRHQPGVARVAPPHHSRTRLALAATTLALALLVPFAWWAVQGRGRGRAPVQRIVVLPFVPNQPDTVLNRLGRDLAATVAATLDGLGSVHTVDRLAVLALAADCGAGCSEEQSAQLVRKLGAWGAVQGILFRTGDGTRVEFTLTSTERAQSIVRGSVVVPGEALGALTDSITWTVLRGVWRSGEPPTPSLASVTTHSLPALRAFLDGEAALVAAHFRVAASAFRSAVTADPGFWLAYQRLQLAQYWLEEEWDPATVDSLERHRSALAPRDRRIVEAWSARRGNRFNLSLEILGEVTQRFPDHWPAWFMYGDDLAHFGGINGIPRSQARAALQRAVALNPGLIGAWSHLLMTSIGEDTATSGLALRRLRTLGWFERSADEEGADEAWFTLMEALGRTDGRFTPAVGLLADQVARRLEQRPGPGAFEVGPEGALWIGYPAAQLELERRAGQFRHPHPPTPASVRRSALSWAARGAWGSALTLLDAYVEDSTAPAPALERYRLTVEAAWLGLLDPAQAVERRRGIAQLLALAPPSPATQQHQALLAWLDGLLAFRQRDRDALRRAESALETLDLPDARFNRRSLAAFDLALDGDSTAAGHRLAALEWECTRVLSCGLGNYDIAVHHLAAANWLLAAGDTVEAQRLLVWHEAWLSGRLWSGTEVLAGLAALRGAQVAEAQGRLTEALRGYNAFLRRTDRPDPAMAPRVRQAAAARDRVAARLATR